MCVSPHQMVSVRPEQRLITYVPPLEFTISFRRWIVSLEGLGPFCPADLPSFHPTGWDKGDAK